MHDVILRGLPALLLRTGYIDAMCVFGVLHTRHQEVEARRAAASPCQRAMLDLWFLERPVSRDELGAALSEGEIASLLAAGIIVDEGGALRSDIGMAMPMFGQILFVPGRRRGSHVYFGPDSIALAIRVAPPPGSRCLDLCTGAGILALRAAAAGGRVVATDNDPEAVDCARRNAVINSLDGQIDVRAGDLGGALHPGERFDFVVANPPNAVVPPELRCSSWFAGGADGTQLLRRVLDLLPEILTEAGAAQIVLGGLGNADTVHVIPALDTYATLRHMQVVMTVTGRMPLAPGERVYERLIAAYATETNRDAAEVEPIFANHLRTLHATHVYRYTLMITRGSPYPGLSVARYDRFGGSGFFL